MTSVVFPLPPLPQYQQHRLSSHKQPFIFTVDTEQINCFDYSPSDFVKTQTENYNKHNVMHAQTYPYIVKPKEKHGLVRSNSWSFDLSH